MQRVQEAVELIENKEDFLIGVYDEDVVDVVLELKENRAAWNVLKGKIRNLFKATDGATVSLYDDWMEFIEEKSSEISLDLEGFDSGVDKESLMPDVHFLERGDQASVADDLLARMQRNSDVVFDRGYIHVYNNDLGYYERLTESDMFTIIKEDYAGIPIKRWNPEEFTWEDKGALNLSINFAKGVYQFMRHDCNRVGDFDREGYFDEGPRGILYKNTFLKVDGGGVVEVKPNFRLRQTFRVEADYDDEVELDTPLLDDYFESTFEGDVHAGDKKRLILEFAAASLAGIAVDYEKAFILYDNTDNSAGSNGKSVFIKVLKKLFPNRAIASEDPTAFSNKNVRAAMAGKRLNCSAEMPEDSGVIDGQAVKSFITGDQLAGEFKFKDRFYFSPTAGHLFATNNFPSVKDDSGAFWRRWVVIPFNNRFTGSDKKVGLAERIVKEEGQKLLVLLGRALKDLVERGHYIIPPCCEVAKAKWRREANPIEQFLIDCCKDVNQQGVVVPVIEEGEDEDASWTDSNLLYDTYKTWAKSFGFYPVSVTKFGRRVGNRLEKRRKGGRTEYRCRLIEESRLPHNLNPNKFYDMV